MPQPCPASLESEAISARYTIGQFPIASERARFRCDMKGETVWGWYEVRWLQGWISWLKSSSSSDPETVNVYAQGRSYTYQIQSLDAPRTYITLELVQVGPLGSRYIWSPEVVCLTLDKFHILDHIESSVYPKLLSWSMPQQGHEKSNGSATTGY